MVFFVDFAHEPADFKIEVDQTKTHTFPHTRMNNTVPLYNVGDAITGTVDIKLTPSFGITHQGVEIDFLGQIVSKCNRFEVHEFDVISKQLLPPGPLDASTRINFEFDSFETKYECFTGSSVKMRYLLRVTARTPNGITSDELEIFMCKPALLQNRVSIPIRSHLISDEFKMTVSFKKDSFHLEDIIEGEVTFQKVNVNLNVTGFQIMRQEHDEGGILAQHLLKIQPVVNGNPPIGVSIPIRMELADLNLSPSMFKIENLFRIFYFVRISCLDEFDRIFIRDEIIEIYRRADQRA